MISYRHGPSTRLFLFICPFVLVALTVFLSYKESTRDRMHACYIQRESEEPAPTFIPFGDGQLHDYSVLILWIAMLILALLPTERMRGVFSLAYISVWFHSTYILLAALKAPLDDFNCAGRHATFPNGISGHYCYFIFVSLTAPVFAITRLQSNPQTPKAVVGLVAVLMALFGIGAVGTLYRTFFHGYHSAHQIFLGIALGMFSHALLEAFYFRDEKSPMLSQALMVLVANLLISASLYYQLWPHEGAGPAISHGDVKFQAALWGILAVSGSLSTNTTSKVSTD